MAKFTLDDFEHDFGDDDKPLYILEGQIFDTDGALQMLTIANYVGELTTVLKPIVFAKVIYDIEELKKKL